MHPNTLVNLCELNELDAIWLRNHANTAKKLGRMGDLRSLQRFGWQL